MNSNLLVVWTLSVLSLLGLLGLSILWPAMAYPTLRWRERKTTGPSIAPSVPDFIEIIIPAHNEALTIEQTLASLQRAVQVLQHEVARPPRVLLHLGADSCTDGTIQVAQKFPGIMVSEFPQHRSKWLTLRDLCTRSDAGWVVLVDSGTIWPDTLLRDMFQQMANDPKAIGLSPAYRPLRSSWLHSIVWKIEENLKRIEAACGGPVSVHGATVAYRTEELKRAFQELGTQTWLNDDVVIPLMLRTLNPDRVISYPIGEVFDLGVQHDKPGLQRRRRILIGNLQWAGSLLPRCFRMNPIAGLIAMRRLFRVLWAYWACFIAIGFALLVHQLVPIFLLAAVFIVFSRGGRDLAAAAWVSLQTPLRLLQPQRQLQGVWK
jgi:cellulose synthase/poly-beta-1,6-N-acetylglucosamine synthase-like glycosyltransferase